MDRSKIFTPRELKEIKLFEKGNRKDSQGVFSNRVKPKIVELLNYWFPKKNFLERLLGKKK
jgi:hypothetical protein